LGGTLVRSKKFEDGKDGPELTPVWGSWVKEKIGEDIYGLNRHLLSANIAANIMEKRQSVTVSANLPPLDEVITTNASFSFWISTTTVNFRIEKPEASDEWIHRPITIAENLRFGSIGSFTYDMTIDPEKDNEISLIRSTLRLQKSGVWNLNASFSMATAAKSVFVSDTHGGHWEKQGEPELIPRDVKFSYSHSFSDIGLFNDRIMLSFSLAPTLDFDLQEYTNSFFLLSYRMSMTIPGFMKFTLAASTKNDVIWRYFKDVPGMEELTVMYPSGPQNNIFTDLIDSFNFFDDSKRRRSGFKMSGFDFSLEHFLGDWTAELGVKVFAHRNTNITPSKYELTADISFVVKWLPITEIKSEATYQGRTDKWEIVNN
jgi:hypothetical protein